MGQRYVLTRRLDPDLLPPGTDMYPAHLPGGPPSTIEPEYLNVSLKPDGGAPVFTVPAKLLREIA